MITVTERAKEELVNLLVRNVDWPGARLRLLDRGKGRLGLGIDIQHANDRIIEHDGAALLLVDERLAANINQVTLDVDDGPNGAEIVICE